MARDVRNNWALLAGVGLVSLGGALTYLFAGEQSVAIPVYFLVTSLSLVAFTFAWFKSHPPAMRAPGWAYVVVVVLLEFGAFASGVAEDTRTTGPWIAVGLAFGLYGLLERSRLIVVAGLTAAVVAVLAALIRPPMTGVWLELITALIFGTAAGALHRSPRLNPRTGD